MAQPSYSPTGAMTAIPQPASPSSAFTAVYDAWNRLTQLIGVATYSYDGLNRRTTKTVSGVLRDLYYSNDWQVHEERVGGATTADRQFVWGQRYIDDLVLRDRSTERLYALQDANWNVTAIVNTSGMVQERYSYTAYGLPTFLNPDFSIRTSGSAYAWETLYCGYRWDSDSWLYQVRNRYLNSLLGLWITRDPIGFEGDPANIYRYVRNQALGSIDPVGLADPSTGPCEIRLVAGHFFPNDPVDEIDKLLDKLYESCRLNPPAYIGGVGCFPKDIQRKCEGLWGKEHALPINPPNNDPLPKDKGAEALANAYKTAAEAAENICKSKACKYVYIKITCTPDFKGAVMKAGKKFEPLCDTKRRDNGDFPNIIMC